MISNMKEEEIQKMHTVPFTFSKHEKTINEDS